MEKSPHTPVIGKILLLVNPAARHGSDGSDRAEAWLRERGWEVVRPSPDALGFDALSWIRHHRSDVDVVAVGGGDGSLTVALPALLEADLPLLVLPMGTANNLARSLGVPRDLEAALALLEQGRLERIDVGEVNGLPFLNVVGLGLSTMVNRLVHPNLKRWMGVGAFILTAFKVIVRMTPFRVFVEVDGETHSARTWQITICNGRTYGPGWVIDDKASFDDRLLHGVSTEVRNWWRGFRLVPSLIAGRFRSDQDVTTFSGKVIRVRTKHPMRVDVDGDVRAVTPLEIRVKPGALAVYVPI